MPDLTTGCCRDCSDNCLCSACDLCPACGHPWHDGPCQAPIRCQGYLVDLCRCNPDRDEELR